MISLPSLLALWFSAVVAGAPIPAAVAADAPAFGDECVYPAGWAPPFTHVYHLRGGATVVFVATEHTRDPADATHRQIADAIDRYRPGFVLVEGVASSKAASEGYRTFLVDRAAADTRAGAIQETLFAVKLAADRGIGFAGWDLSPDENVAADLGDGLAMADVLGTHLIHAGVDPADPAGGARAVERETAYAARVRPVGAFDYAGWYRRNYGAAFDRAHATPCDGGIGGRVTKAETRHRNLNLVAAIERHAAPGTVLLVEGGANHWLALRGYLQSLSTRWS